MKEVLIVQHWVPSYRKPFFERLRELGSQSGIHYEVIAGKPPKNLSLRGDHVVNANVFRSARIVSFSLLGRELTYQFLGKSLKGADLVIFEHAIKNINANVWGYLRKPTRLAWWGHGRTYTKNTTAIEARLKQRLLRNADWYFAYTGGGARDVSAQGFSHSKVTVVRNSTDTSTLSQRCAEVTQADVEQFRRKMQLGSGPVCIFIGALDESKRLDFLIKSATEIHRQVPTFQLLIFGNGPLRDFVEDAAQGQSYVKYCGRADLETQALLSHVADLILMPGRVGLIAVDSFAMGIPIATTNWPYHAPEFEYLEEGKNAIISEDDPNLFANKVITTLMDPLQLNQLATACREEISKYSIEEMAQNFHSGVLSALKFPVTRARRGDFLGLSFPLAGMEEALTHFINSPSNTRAAVHFVNSFTISLADSSDSLLGALREDLLICDGTPLAKYLSLNGVQISPTRGPRFMREFFRRSTSSTTHFLLGSTSDTLSSLIENAKRENPQINIVGHLTPEISSDFSRELDEWANLINISGANFVWVGLGTPKQDYVVNQLAKRVNATFFAVGAAFDYFAETVKEAPTFLHNSGFEWVYRLLKEPRRLWKRYLLGNMRFFYICVRESIKKPFG